jgi:hypothetical protein
MTVNCDGLGVMAACVEVAEQDRGQAGSVVRPAVACGVRRDGDQVGSLRVKPCPGRGGI